MFPRNSDGSEVPTGIYLVFKKKHVDYLFTWEYGVVYP